VPNPITLTGANHKIRVDGTTGVFFSTTTGKINATAYELGGKEGTFSDGNGAVGGFYLAPTYISKLHYFNGSASLSYELDDADGVFFLSIKEGNTAKLEGVNVNATAGSIAFLGGSTTLVLTQGGSVSTSNGVVGALGMGELYIVTNAAGSLVAGTNIHDNGIIMPGSYSTLSASIHAKIPFVTSGTEAAFGKGQGNGANKFRGAGAERI
jgi:hypothetical protein